MMRASELRAVLSRPWKHGESADLRGIRVEEPLDLSDLALGGFDLSGSHFAAPVRACRARFEGLAWFQECTFAAGLDVSGALLVNDGRFEACTFARETVFSGAEFRGIARFDRAIFTQRARLDGLTCFGNLSLDHTDFPAGADLSGTVCLGGFWGNAARFGAGSDFSDTQIHGRLWLRGAKDGNAPLADQRFGLSFGYTYV